MQAYQRSNPEGTAGQEGEVNKERRGTSHLKMMLVVIIWIKECIARSRMMMASESNESDYQGVELNRRSWMMMVVVIIAMASG